MELRLSAAELRFVKTFGYLRLPGLLRHRIDEIERAFEAHITAAGGGAYAGEHRFTVDPGINGSEALCRMVLDDDCIDAVASNLLGEDYQYCNSEVSYCGGDTPWHCDAPTKAWARYGGWYKLAMYLDPLTRATGALRVIPGSHCPRDDYATMVHGGIVDPSRAALVDPREAWGVEGAEVPAVALVSEPGDLIVFNYLTAHASFGGAPRRRLLTLWLFPKLADADLDQIRAVIGMRAYTRRDVFGDPRRAEPLLATASPRRLRHLEQLLANLPDDETGGLTLRRFLEPR